MPGNAPLKNDAELGSRDVRGSSAIAVLIVVVALAALAGIFYCASGLCNLCAVAEASEPDKSPFPQQEKPFLKINEIRLAGGLGGRVTQGLASFASEEAFYGARLETRWGYLPLSLSLAWHDLVPSHEGWQGENRESAFTLGISTSWRYTLPMMGMLTLDARLFGQWQRVPAGSAKPGFSADPSLIYLKGQGAMGNIALEACASSIQPGFFIAPVELLSPVDGQPFYYRDTADSLQVNLSGKYRTPKKITYGGTLFWRSPIRGAESQNGGNAGEQPGAGLVDQPTPRVTLIGPSMPVVARMGFISQSSCRLKDGLLGIASTVGGDLTLAGGLSLGEAPPTYLVGAEYKGKSAGWGYSVGLGAELGDSRAPWLGLTGTARRTIGSFVYELTSRTTLLGGKAAPDKDVSPNRGSAEDGAITHDPCFPSPWTWRGSSAALRIAPLGNRGLSGLVIYDWDTRRLTLGGSISY